MNNKRLVAVLMSVCLAFLAQPAAAAKGFNYNYVEGGYRDIDGDSIGGNGFEAGFSFGAMEYLHIIGRYSHLSIDDLEDASRVDLDVDEFKIGFGGNYPIMDKVDLALDAFFVDEEITGKVRKKNFVNKTRINESNTGYEAIFYARVQALKKLEMTPHVVYRDVGDNSDTGFGLGLVYNFYKKLSLRVRGTRFSDDNATNLFLGMRADM